jgi:hypothetical protein
MVDQTNPDRDATEPLDFEHAEYAEQPAGVECELCGKNIPDYYYQVSGKTMCKHCQPKIAAELARTPRFWRAAGFGSLAAIAGSLIWYGIIAATGYELGLIAIVVGLMVGGAVRKGSGGTGGLSLQLLAVFLTYTSIVSSYTPLLFQEFKRMAEEEGGAIRVGDGIEIAETNGPDLSLVAATPAPTGTSEAALFLASFGDALSAWSSEDEEMSVRDSTLDVTYRSLQQLLQVDAEPSFAFGGAHVLYAGFPLPETGNWSWNERLPEMGFPSLEFSNEATRLDLMSFLDEASFAANMDPDVSAPMTAALGIGFLLAVIYLSPILAGFENFIGLLIIGFALWEAWKMNRRPDIKISGPLQVKRAHAAVS